MASPWHYLNNRKIWLFQESGTIIIIFLSTFVPVPIFKFFMNEQDEGDIGTLRSGYTEYVMPI